MRTLKFGETPFDHLSQDELKTIALKLYSALLSAHSTMQSLKAPGIFWESSSGSGYRALLKTTEALKEVRDDEVKLAALKLYSALLSAYSVMRLAKGPRKPWAYPNNTEHKAILETAEVLGEVHADLDESTICGSFFRYADQILFKSVKSDVVTWMFCPKCQSIIDSNTPKGAHGLLSCDGEVRDLRLDDIKPDDKQ